MQQTNGRTRNAVQSTKQATKWINCAEGKFWPTLLRGEGLVGSKGGGGGGTSGTPCMTFRLVVVSLRGPGQGPRSSLRVLLQVAAFCRPLRPVLLLVSFPRLRSPVVGVLGLCWIWQDVPFAR